MRRQQPSFRALRSVHGSWHSPVNGGRAESTRAFGQDPVFATLHDRCPESAQLEQQNLWELWSR